jgi:low affinity Fe/Cu permease
MSKKISQILIFCACAFLVGSIQNVNAANPNAVAAKGAKTCIVDCQDAHKKCDEAISKEEEATAAGVAKFKKCNTEYKKCHGSCKK